MRIRSTNPEREAEQGYLLIGLVVAVFLIALFLTIAAPTVARQLERDREVESEHRAQQYVRAIQNYYIKFNRYPTSVEQLLNQNDQHFLRQQYKDPLTGGDYRLIHFGEAKTTVKGFFGEELEGAPQGGNLESLASSASDPSTTHSFGGGASGGGLGSSGGGSGFSLGSGVGGSSSGLGGGTGSGFGSGSGLGSGSTGLGSGSTGLGSGSTGLGSGSTGLESGSTGLESGSTGLGSGSTGLGSSSSGLGSGSTGSGSNSGVGGATGSQTDAASTLGGTSATQFQGSKGAIVGVGSDKTGPGIVEWNGSKNIEEWEFLYDPRVWAIKQQVPIAGGSIGQNGSGSFGTVNGNTNGLGSNTPSTFGSGFGSSPTTSPTGSSGQGSGSTSGSSDPNFPANPR